MVRVEGILKNWPASKPSERMAGAEPDQQGEVGSEAGGKRVHIFVPTTVGRCFTRSLQTYLTRYTLSREGICMCYSQHRYA